MEVIREVVAIINNTLDAMLPSVALLGLLGIAVFFTARWLRGEGAAGDILSWVLLILGETVAVILFWFFPQALSRWTSHPWLASLIRWAWMYIGIIGSAYYFSRKYGGRRGVYSALAQLSVMLFGWLLDRWVGILFISIPLLAGYYFTLYWLASIVVPTSKPGERGEMWKRFKVLVSYSWGVQPPLLVAADHAGRHIEKRIEGNSKRNWGIPGLFWTRSYQAVGITDGAQFKRVDGPGIVFTGRSERPFEVVDLRKQSRSSDINAISKDGILFKATLLASFAIDRQDWSSEEYDHLRRANLLLVGGKAPDYVKGSYPFSRLRVRAALGTTGINTSLPDSETPEIHWDDWALSQIEEAARHVLSQRSLDELWQPKSDMPGATAPGEISDEIKKRVSLPLQASGIRLDTVRIVDFLFTEEKKEGDKEEKQKELDKKKEDKISQRLIETWSADWEQQRQQTLTEGDAEAERLQQEARVYAHSFLLTVIAESMRKVRNLLPKYAPYVIAMSFVGAMEELIQKQPEKGEELLASIRGIKQRITADRSGE